MSAPELSPQVDFSGGQINETARRRSDMPVVRAGARKALNWRITNTSQLCYRPGRRALFPAGGARDDSFRVSTGEEFRITFQPGAITLRAPDGGIIATSQSIAYLWREADVNLISWAQAQDNIYICYPGMRPQIVAWDRINRAWSFGQFAFDSGGGVIKQPYYRLSALGATFSYSGVSGSITLTCSQAFFTAAMIGATLSILGQQVTITAVASATSATATPSYRLPDAIAVNVVDTTPFQVGQIVSAVNQNIKFEVGFIDAVGKLVHGVLMSNLTFQTGQFTNADTLVSPLGSSKFGAAAPVIGAANLPTVQWQEEFMSSARGWPASVSYDRGRIIFSDFPQAQNAILWSAIAAPQSFWVDSVAAANQPSAGANANSAMLELITGNPHVRYVIGWQQGQFTFSDRGVFFTPISNSSPLIPGSVEFNRISDDGTALIRPVTIQDAIIFMNAGGKRCSAVRATGTATRPFIAEDVSDAHGDLFKSPIQIAVANGDVHPERYIYVLNADSSVVVGKIIPRTDEKIFVGWVPWTSKGFVTWLMAVGPSVYLTTRYDGHAYVVEVEDDSTFFDMATTLNAPASGMTPPLGKGPLWLLPGATVSLMDRNLDLGDRIVDADGFVIANGQEDLTSPTLQAGFFTPAEFQPIVHVQNSDRTEKIAISEATANVNSATTFTLGKKVFPTQKFDDDSEGQPVLLDRSVRVRPLGRSYDPTISLVKHRPGPITLCEFSMKVSN